MSPHKDMQEDNLLWTPGESFRDVERRLILKVFKHCKGNKTKAAKAIQISLRNLRDKLKKYKSEKVIR